MSDQHTFAPTRRALLGTGARLVAAPSASAAPLGMDMAGFVLGKGPPGRCDDYRLGGANVVHDPATGLWRMWYYCRDRAFDVQAPGTLGSGQVALALSPDGVRWTRTDGPTALGSVLAPTGRDGDFDSLHLGVTDISIHEGEYLMWYFGGDRTRRDTGSKLGVVTGLGLRPGLARSRDGVHWTRVIGMATGGALFDIDEDAVYAGWPNVIHDGSRWIMQYSAPLPGLIQYPTRLAVSDDLVTWRKIGSLNWLDGPRPWDASGLITRQVIANPLNDRRRWLMIYTGADERHQRTIDAAESDDGINWRHLYDTPAFTVGAPDAWDSLGVAVTRVMAVEGRLYLYYYGFQSLADDERVRGVGLAISETGDPRDLRRVKTV